MLYTSDSEDDFIEDDYITVVSKYKTVQMKDGSIHKLPVVNKL